MSQDVRLTKRKPDDVPQATVDHFIAMPFALKAIADPAFQILSQSRSPTHEGRGHTLMGKTWATDETVRHLLTLYRPSASPNATHPQPDELSRAEMRRFYTFGNDLNSHPDLLHGGVIACILDSSMGGAVGAKRRGAPPTFTVQLNITYKKPVRAEASVVVRSWVTKVEDGGRKTWAKGVVEGKDGVEHASAEGLWVQVKVKAKV